MRGTKFLTGLALVQAKVVLTAFTPTDTRTAGTVTFDNVGVSQ